MINLIKNKRDTLIELCNQYNVKHLEIFGSALDESTFNPHSSDIDFLVEFHPLKPVEHAKYYFEFLEKLQDMFGRNVDLIEVKAIKNPYLLESVNKTRTEIYAA